MADPNDIFAQRESVARRQKLLDAMTQQNMGTPIQGNTGLGQALAKIATAWVLKNNAGKLDEERSQADKAYGAGLGSEVDKYLKTRAGTAGQVLDDSGAAALMEGNVNPMLAEPQKADPRAAVVNAMASRFPEMQQLGRAELPGLVKQDAPMTQKDILSLGGFDPESRLTAALSGNIAGLKPENEFMNVDGRVVNKRKPTEVGADYRETFGEPYRIGGDLYQDDSRGKRIKLDNAPNVKVTSISNVMNAGSKAGMEQWAKNAANTVNTLGEQARSAVGAVTSLNQLEKLSDSGTFTGPTSGAATWLGQLANAAGMKVDANQLANSENFTSVAADAAQKIIGQYGGNRGVTKEEAEQIKNIVPQLTHSPQARTQLTTILRGMAQRQIEDYQQANSAFNEAIKADDPTKFNFGPTMLPNPQGLPSAPGVPVKPQKPTVTNW